MKKSKSTLQLLLFGLSVVCFVMILSSCQSQLYKSFAASKQIQLQHIKNPRDVQ